MSKFRFDVWLGRIAATAGFIYVALASIWPLNASIEVEDTKRKRRVPYFFTRVG
jgi:hypothetical protein